MSLGTILVCVGVSLVVAAYLARPFRAAQSEASVDRAIESWVSQARTVKLPVATDEDEAALFCTQCGRRAAADDRFCARCGTSLPGRGE